MKHQGSMWHFRTSSENTPKLLRFHFSIRSIAGFCLLLVVISSADTQQYLRQERLQDILSAMTIEEKVGQLLQLRVYAEPEDTETPDVDRIAIETIARDHIGSIDLRVRTRGPNLIRVSSTRLARVTNELQSSSKIPLLIGADIERGLIARVSDAPDNPMIMAFGASGNSHAVWRLAEITGREARSIGINWTFAPVADLNEDPSNPVIGDRAFGEDPTAVKEMITQYITGAHKSGLIVTAKHFPGQGNTKEDSHIGSLTISSSLAELRANEFVPFKAAIDSGVDAVMLAHAFVPSLDPDPHRVATTSRKIVETYLRKELGFRGVVMTDAVEMEGLLAVYEKDPHPDVNAAIDAIKAGVDIIMLSNHVDEVQAAILDAVSKGEISQPRIDESVLRILIMKERAGLFTSRLTNLPPALSDFLRIEDSAFAQQIADDSVVLVKNDGTQLPLTNHGSAPGRLVCVLFSDSGKSTLGRAFESELIGRRRDAVFFHIYYDGVASQQNSAELINAVQNADVVLVAVFVTNLPGRQYAEHGRKMRVVSLDGRTAALFDQIMGVAGKKLTVVALGSPYLIDAHPAIPNYVCTFSTASTSERSAVKGLFGEIQNNARLPVTLPGVANRGFAIKWPPSKVSAAHTEAKDALIP